MGSYNIPKNKKGIYMIIPREAHNKLKQLASKKNKTMTDLFVKWVDGL